MSAPVQQGEVLAGKYRVDRVLGAGGMGVVVLATHQELGQRVALKFLLRELGTDPTLVARFLREVRAAAQINSEHVARVTDVGRLDDGTPYMVMEYLEGTDLSTLIAQQGPLPLSEAAEYIVHACEALAVAHAIGIVHRDVKPANLFLTHRPDGSPVVKVLDFGISKKALTGKIDDGNVGLTQTSSLMGSPVYMSPEQMQSARDVDHRTDIWSLGIVLYELLTGQTAFEGETITAVCFSVLKSEPRPPSVQRPEIPGEVDAIVARCLQKNAADRFQNVGELAQALAPFTGARASIIADRARETSSAVRAGPRPAGDEGGVVPSQASDATPRPPAAVGATSIGGGVARSHGDGDPPERPVAGGKVGATLAVGLAAVLGVAAASLLVLRMSPAGPEPSEVPKSDASQAAPASSKAVALRIRSNPAGAQVFDSEDRLLGRTPLVLSLDDNGAGQPRRFVVKLDGYLPYAIVQPSAGSDVDVMAELAAEAPTPPASAPPSAGPPTHRVPSGGRPPRRNDPPKPVIRETL